MALYFNCAIVTRTRDEADACAEFFRVRPLVIEDEPVVIETFVHPRRRDFLVGVWPKGMSYASPHGDDRRLTRDDARAFITRWFDEALREAPPFAAAVFGGEAYDSFLDDEELHEQLEGGLGGLFVDDALYQALGRPSGAIKVDATRWTWTRLLPE